MSQNPGARNITEGVIWKQLLAFFFPILLGTFFQQMYNTVDTIIVGRFVGTQALAAVGSTGPLINLINGFFIGNPVKIVAEEDAVSDYVEHLDKYNDQDDNNAELSKLGSMFGKGYEMYFTDEEAEQCITYMTPEECFMVYDDSVVAAPLFFVRRFTGRDNTEFGCIYDRANYRNFKITGGAQWIDEDWQPHNYKDVPATEFMQNEERQGLFEPVMSMVNAYNKAISEKANDVDYYADAYLKILGVTLDEESMKHIRDNRIINFEGENAEKLVVDFICI